MNEPTVETVKQDGTIPELGSAAFFHDPYPTYARLRDTAPVFWWPTGQAWFVTRYADVLTALKEPHLGHDDAVARDASGVAAAIGAEAQTAGHIITRRRQATVWMRLWILLRNPPEHTRLRAVLQPHFAANVIAALGDVAQMLVARQMDAVEGAHTFDLIADIARPVSVGLICHLLGMPEEAGRDLQRWSPAIGRSLDPDATPAQQEAGLFAIAALGEYFAKFIADRRRQRGVGLLDALVAAHDDGHLRADELLANVILLFFAGHSTSVGLIGNGMQALLQHPAQQALLCAEPERVPAAVEEMMRYDGPAQVVPRSALADLELAGQPIASGDRVLLCLAAANRDPARFAAPDAFDVLRRPNPHLGFGHGLHLCVGAPLARLNARITITTLLRRWPQIHAGAHADILPGMTVRELHTLRVMV